MRRNSWPGSSRPAGTSSARGLPHARLDQRGRRCRAGDLAAAESLRHECGREPRRLADDGRCARLSRHAALPQVAARGPDRGPDVPEPTSPATSTEHERLSPTRSAPHCWWCWRRWRPPSGLRFVLHDMFAVPFEEIAPIVGRTPAAARQLASRARRRVQGTPPRAPISGGRRRSSTPSSRPPATATSTDCSRCWIPTWCSAPIRPPSGSARLRKSAARRRRPRSSSTAFGRPPRGAGSGWPRISRSETSFSSIFLFASVTFPCPLRHGYDDRNRADVTASRRRLVETRASRMEREMMQATNKSPGRWLFPTP